MPSEAKRDGEPNPKLEKPQSNLIKDPEEWVSGDEPMTGAQASYLKTLSEEANAPEAYYFGTATNRAPVILPSAPIIGA